MERKQTPSLSHPSNKPSKKRVKPQRSVLRPKRRKLTISRPQRGSIKAPVAIARRNTYRRPQFTSTRNGMLISHREMFSTMTVASGKTDQVWGWTINPGWDSMFPWLSGLAQHYELYTIHSMTISFQPRMPTSTIGLIAMSIDFDANDPLPTEDEAGRVQMLSANGAAQGSVWAPLTIRLPGNTTARRTNLFIRTPTSETFEPRTSDLGLLNVGVFGVTAPSALTVYGDLVVDYTVELSNPQFSPSSAPSSSGFGFGSLVTKATNAMGTRALDAVKTYFGDWVSDPVSVFDTVAGSIAQQASIIVANKFYEYTLKAASTLGAAALIQGLYFDPVLAANAPDPPSELAATLSLHYKVQTDVSTTATAIIPIVVIVHNADSAPQFYPSNNVFPNFMGQNTVLPIPGATAGFNFEVTQTVTVHVGEGDRILAAVGVGGVAASHISIAYNYQHVIVEGLTTAPRAPNRDPPPIGRHPSIRMDQLIRMTDTEERKHKDVEMEEPAPAPSTVEHNLQLARELLAGDRGRKPK